MSQESQTIVEFCRVLACVRTLFRDSHIAAENSGHFADVKCTVSHAEKDLLVGEKRVGSIEVSFSLDGELPMITDDVKYSLGASVAIYNMDDDWACRGDVGWSHRDSGWEEFTSMDTKFTSLAQLGDGLSQFVESVLRNYGDLVNQHFGLPSCQDRNEK